MLNRWRRAIVGRPPEAREARPPTILPKLAEVPALPVGDPRGLSAVEPAVISDYLGRRVRAVEFVPPDDPPAGTTGPAIPRPAGDHSGKRWLLHFDDGVTAEVRLHLVGAPGSAFPGLQARFVAERDGSTDPAAENISVAAAGSLSAAPYETYFQSTTLAARGSRHEAVVLASSLDPPRFHETMAGIAVLALRLIDE